MMWVQYLTAALALTGLMTVSPAAGVTAAPLSLLDGDEVPYASDPVYMRMACTRWLRGLPRVEDLNRLGEADRVCGAALKCWTFMLASVGREETNRARRTERDAQPNHGTSPGNETSSNEDTCPATASSNEDTCPVTAGTAAPVAPADIATKPPNAPCCAISPDDIEGAGDGEEEMDVDVGAGTVNENTDCEYRRRS